MALHVNHRDVTEFKCYCCGNTFTNELDIQEAVMIHDVGGYGSKIMGDGTRWSLHLCETCFVKIAGPWIKISND